MTDEPDQHPLPPLPLRPRPRPGEPADSYVLRLARANHLRPSYLHEYLTAPHGRLRIERLAAICGRPASTLQRALTGLTPPRRPRPRPDPPDTGPPASTRIETRTHLFAAIRADHRNEGLSIRALAARHKVHRRTVHQALTLPAPPPRKRPPPRQPRALPEDARSLIDQILIQDLALPARRRHSIRAIRARLLDDHNITASYSTVRDYAARRRAELAADTAPHTATAPATTAPVAQHDHPETPNPATRLPPDARSAIRHFASLLANGALAPDLLAGIDYRQHLTGPGSDLDMAFAVFTNVLQIDDRGRVTNPATAQRRAAQWIRACHQPGYRIEPPLQPWETELL